MNDTPRRRLAGLAGLTLVALLVCAMAVQTAAAYNVTGSGAGSGVVALSGPEPAAASSAQTTSLSGATLPGRGGIGSVAADTPARSRTTPTDSNVWAAILFSLAALLAGAVAWIAVGRRRRLTGPSLAAYCARNPTDSMCGAT
jgi:hypothetical protein